MILIKLPNLWKCITCSNGRVLTISNASLQSINNTGIISSPRSHPFTRILCFEEIQNEVTKLHMITQRAVSILLHQEMQQICISSYKNIRHKTVNRKLSSCNFHLLSSITYSSDNGHQD